ncbi:MAG: hypothetical protein IPJ09_20190 [Saprospiraceae bacterium]|nr:hypothetical protein [Saprospiraceae bacterium]
MNYFTKNIIYATLIHLKMKMSLKHITCLVIILFAFSTVTYAQVIPKGMTYQAVARDASGDIIANHQILIKVNLVSRDDRQKTNHYSEIHSVATNEIGLFNVVIGEGNPDSGQFGLIPWNKENIWLEVSVRDGDKKDFIF